MLPQTPIWFQGAALRQEGNGGREEGLGKERGERGSWGNSALVVGGIDAPVHGQRFALFQCFLIIVII